MRTYSAAEAAEELGVSARKLRSLLRDSPKFKNAGPGGTYQFTTSDIPALKRLVRGRKVPRASGVPLIEDSPGLPWRVAQDCPAEVKRITKEREERLEAALLMCGRSVSQMTEGNWHSIEPENWDTTPA